jgi:protein TonB
VNRALPSAFAFREETIRRCIGWGGAALVHLLVALLVLFPGLRGGSPAGFGESTGKSLTVFSLPDGSTAAGKSDDPEAGAARDADTDTEAQGRVAAERQAEAGGGADAGRKHGKGGDTGLDQAIAGAVADDPLGGNDWYRSQLRYHLVAHRRTPGAGRGARQGTVVIRFTLSREGRVIDARVVMSRGASLDQAALATLWDAEPMPPVPSSLPAPIEIDMPVDFVDRG